MFSNSPGDTTVWFCLCSAALLAGCPLPDAPRLEGTEHVEVYHLGAIDQAPFVVDASGEPIDDLVWMTQDSDIAEVSPSGEIHARGPGSTELYTRHGEHLFQWTLTVRPLIHLRWHETPSHLEVGQEHTFEVQAVADGTELRPHGLEWSSSAPEVVTVDKDGTAHAHAPGRTYINVSWGTGKATLEMDVHAPTPDSP